MLLQVILDADDGHPVDARTTLIGPHLPQCCLQVFSLTYCLHQSIRAGWVFVPIRRPGRFSLYPSRLSGFTRQPRREVQFHLEILLRVVLEIHGLLTAPSRSGLQPPFPARPIHCSAFRHSECLTSLADVMTCRVGGGALGRPRAGHRPPLKLYVQFSRIQLSRRLTLPRRNGRDQLNQVHQPVLAIQLGFRQLSPATVPPPLESMRPNAPHDPTVEPVEELSDVGSLVVMSPPPQHRVQFLNQLLGLKRHTSAGKRAYLIHESPDRFLTRKSIQRPRLGTTANLARWQPKLLAALDLVP